MNNYKYNLCLVCTYLFIKISKTKKKKIENYHLKSLENPVNNL